MASIHCGQAALIPLPQKASKLQYLTDTIIAKSLTVEQSAVKDEGMLVYKVGKVRISLSGSRNFVPVVKATL